MTHPEIVGADKHYEAVNEYPLPSLDAIDVLFRSEGDCIAVEVKSRVSEKLPSDYRRGLYQCVKYVALLRAMVDDCDCTIPENVRSVLVLETELPRQYRDLSEVLGVEVIEGVAVEGTTEDA